MNEYRNAIRIRLAETKKNRPAALRRSKREDWLYATDLPQAAEEANVRKFIESVQGAGWRTKLTDGWILLDPVHLSWPGGNETVTSVPESACCRSILERHPYKRAQSDGSTERILIKAAEEGRQAYEEACRGIHRKWAAAMREHRPVPDIEIMFFGGTKYADPAHRSL